MRRKIKKTLANHIAFVDEIDPLDIILFGQTSSRLNLKV